MLLPTGGAARAVPASAPHRALALDALTVLRLLRDHPRDAGSWGEPAFARAVDAIRRQLDPIRDRRMLTASYAREAFRLPPADAGTLRPPTARPAAVAYAIRWLELGDGVRRPPWTRLVAGRG
ncbi:MAG TPA: hypothetical protein VGQ31_10580 [Candidatus Limnocylindrales bacterium]|nr:hypothetical protein [Candidatus Limnocylindrales bacterium]